MKTRRKTTRIKHQPMATRDLTPILDALAGGMTLRAWCRANNMHEATVRNWIRHSDANAGEVKYARDLGCDALADECIEIADNPLIDPADKRIRIETRLKVIGKWSQRYGDKVQVEQTSEVRHVHDFSGLTDAELEAAERIALRVSGPASDPAGNGAPGTDPVHAIH